MGMRRGSKRRSWLTSSVAVGILSVVIVMFSLVMAICLPAAVLAEESEDVAEAVVVFDEADEQEGLVEEEPVDDAAVAEALEDVVVEDDVDAVAEAADEAVAEDPVAEAVGDDVSDEAAVVEEQTSEIEEPAEVAEQQSESVAEAPEPISYPAVTLSKTIAGVTVTLSAPEGSLPEGVDMIVVPVYDQSILDAVEEEMARQGRELTDAVAFDVTLVDKDGQPVQPLSDVTVSFSNTNLAVDDEGEVSVFCVSDDAEVVTEMATEVATPDEQQFSTDHFTIYVAGGSASDPNGDGSGANTTSNRYVLEYGESVTLRSSVPGLTGGTWTTAAGAAYINRNGTTITNTNTSSSAQNVTINHLVLVPPTSENFYIRVMPQKFAVTFMLQDAGESSFANIQESTVYRGQAVTDVPAEDDTKDVDGTTYTFFGWYEDEECTTEASFSNITRNMTVYGRYTTLATLHYNKNTSDAAMLPDAVEAGVGNSVQLGDASRSAYALLEWNTEADGSGDAYQPGDWVTMPEDGLELYAQWSYDSMVMRYYRNNTILDTFIYRSVTNLPKNGRTTVWDEHPTRNGYVFLGWSTSRLGDPEFMPGDTITTGSSETLYLYAQWGDASNADLDYETLTAKGETVPYDGQEHTIEGVEEGTPSSDHPGFLKVGRVTLFLVTYDIYARVDTITASGTNSGSYSTPVSVELYYLTPLTGIMIPLDTYIEVTNTVLKITPIELTINTDDAEMLYDGSELTAGGTVTFTDGESEQEATFDFVGGVVTLVSGETLNLRTIGTQTEVGQSENGYEFDWGKPDTWGTVASTALKFNYRLVEGVLGKLTVYYRVDFDENADGDAVEGMPESLKVYDSADAPAAALPSDAPTREVYEFLGWALAADAEEADYQPGDEITLTSDDVTDGVLTLYAVWQCTHVAGDPVIENVVEATCTEDGSHDEVVYCEECVEELSRETVTDPALGHDWGEWEVVEEATEEAEGLRRRVCNRCGEVEEETIPKIEFEYAFVAGDGSEYTLGTETPLAFIVERSVNDDVTFSRTVAVLVDGVELTDEQATLSEGSLEIVLKGAYLETLSEGEHTITAQFEDGEAEAAFMVVASDEPAPEPEPTPAPKPDVPATGEPASIAGLLAAMGGALLLVSRKRKND